MAAPAPQAVLWRSEALADLPVLVRESKPGETCGIFHLDIPDVDVDGLGSAWLEDKSYNTAELPCGHVFATAALALHFVGNDMRCPVCRRGPADCAQISSMAAAMQPALLSRKLDMHAAAAAEDSLELDVNIEALARDFRFEAYMQWAPNDSNRSDCVARLDTPVVRDRDAADPGPEPAAPAPLDAYGTHRSFQRKFNINLRLMPPGANIICLGLTHPLMPDAVRSAMFDKHALLACAAAGSRIPLARGFGFVEPVHSDAGIHLALHLNTSYLSMACLQTMMDWSGYARF
jgi:hypothetical protein